MTRAMEDMSRACVLDFKSTRETHLPLVEFSYNNSYHSSIVMAPFEALYGRQCRSPVCWVEIGDNILLGPDLLRETTEKIIFIKDRLRRAQSRQNNYADHRRRNLEFEVGNQVLFKSITYSGNNAIREEKREVILPRFIGPFQILEKGWRGEISACFTTCH
jgi:hypothetical protein